MAGRHRSSRGFLAGMTLFAAVGLVAVLGAMSACGDDYVQFDWIERPPSTMDSGTSYLISWNVTTDGEFSVTELRACEGEVSDCGDGGADSYDKNSLGMVTTEGWRTNLTLDTTGRWSIAMYAVVDRTGYVSSPVYVTVE